MSAERSGRRNQGPMIKISYIIEKLKDYKKIYPDNWAEKIFVHPKEYDEALMALEEAYFILKGVKAFDQLSKDWLERYGFKEDILK